MSTAAEPVIPRKWSLRCAGRRNVFSLNPNESARHVVMKAMLWALYLPQYPTITIEVAIGDRFKPDLVAYGEPETPIHDSPVLFWGESGVVGAEKLRSILRRYPATHFAFAKWDTALVAHARLIESALRDLRRSAPVELWRMPVNAVDRFVDDDGSVHVVPSDLEHRRWE